MAKELTPEEASTLLTQEPYSKTKYPWDRWSNGSWWQIEHGVDFQRKVDSMRSGISTWARRHGMKAEIHLRGRVILFRLTPLGERA